MHHQRRQHLRLHARQYPRRSPCPPPAWAGGARPPPAALAGRLPQQVDQIGGALTRPAELGQAAAAYLRAAITAAMHGVYLALALAALATLLAALVIVPRRFATGAGATASTGPAGEAAPLPAAGEKTS